MAWHLILIKVPGNCELLRMGSDVLCFPTSDGQIFQVSFKFKLKLNGSLDLNDQILNTNYYQDLEVVTSFELIRAALFRACWWSPFGDPLASGASSLKASSVEKRKQPHKRMAWCWSFPTQKRHIWVLNLCVGCTPEYDTKPLQTIIQQKKAAHVRWSISSYHPVCFSPRGHPSMSLSLSRSLSVLNMYTYIYNISSLVIMVVDKKNSHMENQWRPSMLWQLGRLNKNIWCSQIVVFHSHLLGIAVKGHQANSALGEVSFHTFSEGMTGGF